jgi:4-oxalocrotonate tautomerase
LPLITVSLYPGRSEEQKRLFAEKITNLSAEIIKTKPEHVIVVFDENPKENWYLAGKNL